MIELCTPALIYVIFSMIQIILDTFYGLYNTAITKFFVMLIITFLLNMLCNSGMSIISWIIVFIPFILMTTIVAILLYMFGLKETTGINEKQKDTSIKKENNLIYSSGKTHLNANSNLIYSSSNTPISSYMDISLSEGPLNYDDV